MLARYIEEKDGVYGDHGTLETQYTEFTVSTNMTSDLDDVPEKERSPRGVLTVGTCSELFTQ